MLYLRILQTCRTEVEDSSCSCGYGLQDMQEDVMDSSMKYCIINKKSELILKL